MSSSGRSSNPSFEALQVPEEESIRLLSWDRSLGHPRIFRGNSSHVHSDGMGDRWHYHPEMEITHFTEGEGLRFVGDSIQRFEAPDTILLGPYLPHCWTCDRSSGLAVQCSLSQGSPLAALPELQKLADIGKRIQYGLHLVGGLSREIGDMLHSMRSEGSLSRLAIFLRIMDTVTEAKSDQFTILSNPIDIRSGAGAYSSIIADAIEFITQRFQEPIQLPDLLVHISMSRATFSRHFSHFTGQSFTTFLQQIRLEHCRRLLLMGNFTVTEAAVESGFQNLSHFNRLFRHRWGVTPREFRTQLSHSK